MEPEHFEELVRRALDTLPQDIAARIDNVDVEVHDWPDAALLASARVGRGRTLLGLYQGVPLTRRNSGYNLVAPDRIIIFQGPIERLASNDDELVDRVREVVVHEVAHHFGISDARLAEIERERRQR
ncbi:MAG: metallopeptidase family protein [Dehalococcoidia bacterium]